jgi:hypothetical protein
MAMELLQTTFYTTEHIYRIVEKSLQLYFERNCYVSVRNPILAQQE